MDVLRRYRIFMQGDRQVEMRQHRWYYVGLNGEAEPYECENERGIKAVFVVPEQQLRGAVEALRYCADYRNREAASRVAQDALAAMGVDPSTTRGQ
jgi:hypothetical protein